MDATQCKSKTYTKQPEWLIKSQFYTGSFLFYILLIYSFSIHLFSFTIPWKCSTWFVSILAPYSQFSFVQYLRKSFFFSWRKLTKIILKHVICLHVVKIFRSWSNYTTCTLVEITILYSVNGWQLAKMKKSIPDMSLPWNLWGWSSWSKKLQKYLKNYDICENVKFGAISWKFNILSITA